MVVDRAEVGAYPWVRGDLRFTPDGRRVAYIAAGQDERFLEAGDAMVESGAGGRLVFQRRRTPSVTPDKLKQPVKLLRVEEEIGAE